MKIFLLLSMVIIFICVFFVLSISTTLLDGYKDCLEYQDLEHCEFEKIGVGFAEGMFIVACFVLIIAAVVTMLVEHYLKKSETIEWESLRRP